MTSSLPEHLTKEIKEVWDSIPEPTLPEPIGTYERYRLAMVVCHLIATLIDRPITEVLKSGREELLIILAAAQALHEGAEITDTELARRLGVSRQTIGRSWKGK